MSRVKLSEFKERKRLEGSIEIEADDGTVFAVPPPQLWPDEVADLAKVNDNVGACRVLLGADEYQRFVDAGGSASIMLSIIMDTHGISMGESGASSSS